jgi:hypothetical protein
MVHAKKEEREEIKVRYDKKEKVSLQSTSSNNLHCVNSSLNLSYSM